MNMELFMFFKSEGFVGTCMTILVVNYIIIGVTTFYTAVLSDDGVEETKANAKRIFKIVAFTL